jgi:hypothetical protein
MDTIQTPTGRGSRCRRHRTCRGRSLGDCRRGDWREPMYDSELWISICVELHRHIPISPDRRSHRANVV